MYIAEDMRMRIRRVEGGGKGLFAEFDFGVLEGVMLMALDKEKLARLKSVAEAGENRAQYDDDGGDNEEVEYGEEVECGEEVEYDEEVGNGEDGEDSDDSVIFLYSRKR